MSVYKEIHPSNMGSCTNICRTDEFMQAATAAKERQKAERVVVGTEMTLDPLMMKLNEFATPGELAAMIDNLYKVLDIDDNGGVAFDEMRAGEC